MQEQSFISIVDDDESVREGLVDLVKSMGFMAEAFQRAEDFLQSARHHTSCLITDVQMPEMTGLELHANLASSGDAIPTILITAFPNDRDRTLALRSGVTCYLVKPFSDADLLTSIRSALGTREANESES